jgi:hypothetical protein
LSYHPGSRPTGWPLIYTALALTTLATLLLELSLTRIFSVVFYYHFAFLAISIALFGLGVGGVLSYAIASRPGSLYRKLGRVSLLNSFLVLAAMLFVLTRGADISTLDLGIIYFATALPFLGSGIIVSLVISDSIERVDRIYFFDLLGAAGGCLALVLLLNTFGGPNTVIAVSILFAGGAAVWFSLAGVKIGRIASVIVGLGFTVMVIGNMRYHLLEVRYAKGQKLHTEQFTKWNSLSRIGMAKDGGGEMIYIDADASTGIANFDFNHLSASDLQNLLHQSPSIPYNIRPGARTLVIGPGGGWDISRALASGSRDVTGVEINPIIGTDIMRKMPQLSHGLYLRPDVHIHIEDGRSFVRRSAEKYQVIQATLVDTWASTAAGAFALSENNLYTVEAFRDYLSHLTDDGLLTFTRWGFDPPRESLRLVSLAIQALNDLGERDPARHVLVGRSGTKSELTGWGAQDTVIISRKPLSDTDILHAREAFRSAGMSVMYAPGDTLNKAPDNPFGQLLLAKNPLEYERNYQFDITPVTDNRPFFFYTVQPRDIAAYLRQSSAAADAKVNVALPKLFSALIVSVIAVAIILVLPPVLLGTKLPRERSVRSFLFYFIAIGAGYILIEVALIQKFVLFLGHPTYALTVVIFSMLVSSGLGSFMSRRIVEDRNERLIGVLAIAAALVVVVGATVQSVLTAGVGLPLAAKAIATVVLIAPVGFVMGIPFPTGLRLLEKHHEPSVRWAWSLNAAASVLGSVGALVLALYLGLVQTMLIGGALYLCAMLVVVASPMVRERITQPVSAAVSV